MTRLSADAVLLTTKQAASILRVSASYLNKARLTGEGPPFVRIGRSVRYRFRDLEQWLDERRVRSTSAYRTLS